MNTSKTKKIQVREESVEAIKSISFFLKLLTRIICTPSLSQWELFKSNEKMTNIPKLKKKRHKRIVGR